MESILDSMKKLLGMDASYTVFDVDLVIHINSIFATLAQLGVGAPEGFFIQGSGEEWHTFTSDNVLINNVKSYMYLKLRLMFDPPSSSSVLKSMEEQTKELEWRMKVAADTSSLIPSSSSYEEDDIG